MTEKHISEISADLLGTEQGEPLVAEHNEFLRSHYASKGVTLTRIEATGDHALGVVVFEVTYADDDYAPAPLEFGDENELPAGDSATEGDD